MKFVQRYSLPLLVVIILNCTEKPKIQWDRKTLHDTYCPNGAEQRACTVVDFDYPQFSGYLADSLNRLILNTLCLHFADESPCPDIESIAENFINDFKSFQEELPVNHAGWELQQNIKIVHETSQVLAMKHELYIFTGGAHGMPGEYFINVDKKSGRVLSLDDIIKVGMRAELFVFAKSQFYEQRNIPATQSLEEAGYWFEDQDFYVPDNFSVTHDGLLFLYNPYEIASYADGMVELSIAFDDVESFLKIERLK